MPIADPSDEPLRADPQYGRRDIDALVAYIGSFGGPPIPRVDPAAGRLGRGKETFTEDCAGCHQVMARGGIVTGALVPKVAGVPPRQLGEAVRIGPYLMPKFGEKALPRDELDDVAAYVRYTADPVNRGGWAIGNIGPVPEGMVTWLLGGLVLLGVVRMLGEPAR
jgi:ubiquinol-cytochrome c reductase cytochrome c subunit